MTDDELKKMAKEDYDDCYECGHFPTWVDEPLDDEELKRGAEECDMSVEDFKKYMNFFYGFAC